MKKGCKQLICLACALAALLLAAPALAMDMTATAGSLTLTEGEEVEVTLSVTGEAMAALEGSYSYDPALLSFEESGGGAGDGTLLMATAEKGGSSTLSAHMRFTALQAGEAKIAFTIEKAIGYDGDAIEGGSTELTLSIAAVPVEETPPVDYAKEGVPAQNVEGAQEPMFVWKSIENVTIPSKYSETALTYHGETVMGASVPDSDAPVLLYLSNAAGENAGYYIYEAAQDRLYRYATLSSVSKSYILMQPDAGVAVPEGFTTSTLTVDERELAVWKSQDAAGEVYLVYARNPDGELGFYYYNPQDASLQRYAVRPARPVQPQLTPAPAVPAAEEAEAAEAPAPVESSAPAEAELPAGSLPALYVYVLLAALALVLIVLIAVLISHAVEKKRRRERAAQRRARRAREAGMRMEAYAGEAQQTQRYQAPPAQPPYGRDGRQPPFRG